jgi:hypothetical protein
MLSFEAEIIAARSAGMIDAQTAARRLTIERREIVPIGAELRALAWAAVMLMVTGVGIIITKHFREFGPLSIAVALALAAAACYVWVARKEKAPLDEYVVLLGALLISADIGFIETQWHLLGSEWQRHFLLLAIVHAAAAYFFGSRVVLSLSIAALAAFLGVEKRGLFRTDVEYAVRAFLCASMVMLWREADRRLRTRRDFEPLFDHFAANFAFWGALILTGNRDTRLLGLAMALVLAAFSLRHGFRGCRELFVIYAVVYALIATDVLILDWIGGRIFATAFVLVSTVVAIGALFMIHFRFPREAA